MFAAIQIEDGVLYFDAYTTKDGETTAIDRMAIQKDTAQGEVDPNPPEEIEEDLKDEELKATFKTIFSYIVKIFTVLFNIVRIYILDMKP